MPRFSKKASSKKSRKGTLRRVSKSPFKSHTGYPKHSVIGPSKAFSMSNLKRIVNSGAQGATQRGLPARFTSTVNYAEAFPVLGISVGTAGVGGTELLWGLNSLFDPNQSGVGHQPYYFDQLVTCGYQRYRVDKVDIKVTASNPNNAGTGIMVQFDAWNGSAGTLTGASWNTLKERPNAYWLKPNVSEDSIEESFSIVLADIQGLTRKEYMMSDSYNALVTASPARIPYMRIAAVNIEGSNSGTIWGSVEMKFHFTMMDPQIVAAS